ncbi:hypothetical protein ACIGBL_34255 [Streptomyces sp. NPDC085614]|uniref:hypothetical protein n=1 Tax=Streptomyces sp. NPDC085614 TaxID=3365733 RepID=UPI0037CDAF15
MFAVEPPGSGSLIEGQVGHELGDVDVVGVVAAAREVAQSRDCCADLLVVALDGVVEAQGQFQCGFCGCQASVADFGADQAYGLEAADGPGLPDEGGDLRGEGGGPEIEPPQQLFGEMKFVVGSVRIGECKDEGALGLAGGTLAGDAVLLGLVASGGVGGGRTVHVAMGPEHVAFDTMLAALPAEDLCDFVRGGEVAGDAGEVSQAPLGGWGQAALAVGDGSVSSFFLVRKCFEIRLQSNSVCRQWI